MPGDCDCGQDAEDILDTEHSQEVLGGLPDDQLDGHFTDESCKSHLLARHDARV
jgi:hypothetical protein